jgi:hypothetical protein
LTAARHLNYGDSVSALTHDSQPQITPRSGLTRAAISVLLAALFLYNPFFTILSISQDLSVQHSLSYRATLAGSELRRCTFEPDTPLIPELSAVVSPAIALSKPSYEVGPVQISDLLPLSQVACDSIWFRPPPSN